MRKCICAMIATSSWCAATLTFSPLGAADSPSRAGAQAVVPQERGEEIKRVYHEVSRLILKFYNSPENPIMRTLLIRELTSLKRETTRNLAWMEDYLARHAGENTPLVQELRSLQPAIARWNARSEETILREWKAGRQLASPELKKLLFAQGQQELVLAIKATRGALQETLGISSQGPRQALQAELAYTKSLTDRVATVLSKDMTASALSWYLQEWRREIMHRYFRQMSSLHPAKINQYFAPPDAHAKATFTPKPEVAGRFWQAWQQHYQRALAEAAATAPVYGSLSPAQTEALRLEIQQMAKGLRVVERTLPGSPATGLESFLSAGQQGIGKLMTALILQGNFPQAGITPEHLQQLRYQLALWDISPATEPKLQRFLDGLALASMLHPEMQWNGIRAGVTNGQRTFTEIGSPRIPAPALAAGPPEAGALGVATLPDAVQGPSGAELGEREVEADRNREPEMRPGDPFGEGMRGAEESHGSREGHPHGR